MTDKSAKSQVESVAAEEENRLATSRATRERNFPSYLSNYTDVPGQNKLLTIKNRRRSMRANLTKKINTIDEYLKSRKSRKLIELAVTQLNRAWEQLIENHKEFQTMCSDDKELQDADTWLIESQAVVEEVICRTFEYQERKVDSDGSKSNAPILPKESKQVNPAGNTSVASIGFQSSKKSSSKRSKATSSSSRARARAVAREVDLAKLRVEQVKEKVQLEAKIAAQEAELDAQLAIKAAEQEADRKEKEALLLKQEADEDDIAERMKDFEEDTSVAGKADNSMLELRPKIKKEDPPGKDTKFRVNRVKEWLAKAKPEEEPDVLKDKVNLPKDTEDKDAIVDLTKSGLVRSAVVSSLPKINLPVFNGNPCEWPNWYGMFKALVHDQQLTKTQKMIYLKASVRGSAEKAIAGMFFTGTMYEEAIKELTDRFGNPELISRSLINKLLELPVLKDDNTSSLRTFVDNLHNIVRTLKSYDHGADLKAAANMQLVISRLPSEIAERWSRRKLELQPKEVDLVDLDKWLETEVQVKEMAFGCPNTTETPKQDGGKFRPNLGRSRWSKKQKDMQSNTLATSGTKDECPICKQEHGITLCETWKKAVVNDRWTLAKKFGLCFRCMKRNHRIGRCLLKGKCPVEGCDRRHHAQLHAAIDTPKLNPSAETFHPSQADVEGTSATGTPTAYATCRMIDECTSVRRPGRVALQMVPVILQGKSGIRIKANAFLDGGSGSSYLKEEIADVLGLEAESRPLRVSLWSKVNCHG